jgi:uncharacterized membrane protein
MLVKLQGSTGLECDWIYVNPAHVVKTSYQLYWVGEIKKHFHIAGHVVIEYANCDRDGYRQFDVVLGTLDEVAAALNGTQEAN